MAAGLVELANYEYITKTKTLHPKGLQRPVASGAEEVTQELPPGSCHPLPPSPWISCEFVLMGLREDGWGSRLRRVDKKGRPLWSSLGQWHKCPCIMMVPTVKRGLLSTAATRRMWHRLWERQKTCCAVPTKELCRVVLEILSRKVDPVESSPAVATEAVSHHKREGL